MNTSNLDFGFDISPTPDASPQSCGNRLIPQNMPLNEVILMVLKDHLYVTTNELAEWKIITGRPLNTFDFPIGASDKQNRYWHEKQAKTVRVEIPASEWNWDYKKIVEKYQIQNFHIAKIV